MRSASLALLLLLGGLPPARALRADFEPLRPDLSNVRGANYIQGANPVAMWRFFNAAQAAQELRYLKAMGFNAVRVWLSWWVYDRERTAFLHKFRTFLGLCEKHGLYVMPILWDGFGSEPKLGYGDLTGWHQSPGTARATDPTFWATGREYVETVVMLGRQSPALLVWDIMNEPAPALLRSFVAPYASLVRSLDPAHGITVGHARSDQNVNTPWVDVCSYHPYGVLRINVVYDTRDAVQIAAGRPVLATEIGMPGNLQPYQDVLHYITAQRVGFFLYDATVGVDPLHPVSGLLYGDGTVREAAAARAVQAIARAQGVRPTHPIREKRPTEPGYVAQWPFPVGTRVQDGLEAVLAWRPGTAVFSAFPAYRQLFVALWFSLRISRLVTPADALAAAGLLRGAAQALARNDLAAYRKHLDQLATWTARLLEERGFRDRFSAVPYGAAAAVPPGQPQAVLAAYGTLDGQAVTLLVANAGPGSFVALALGLQAENGTVSVGNGRLPRWVGQLVRIVGAPADGTGRARFVLPLGPLRGIPWYLQALAADGRGNFRATGGLKLLAR